ncbi:hypothetical protein CLV68_4298 [Actinokineospora cianjurensis]|uniref:Uncharacterized protein n=2 Tax=Actinokineospora cianjurensis TaxID=585224 RepID=A0A421B1D8_9PSEU|nr:hypothetical protein CLV68_4298 [Actinokineospora cianjurensis]
MAAPVAQPTLPMPRFAPEPVHDPDAFLGRWVYDNPALAARRELFTRWLTDPTPREDIAEQLGVRLGELLRSFNSTAPLGDPLPFGYRSAPFATVSMAGTCDDVADGRWPLFGTPMTLRCYLRDLSLLPQDMVEAADWNFMDAGLPGFLGYLYGSVHDGTLYLAGLQSDLGVRYSYLFQGRGGGTEVRVGDDVVERSAEEMVAAYGEYVPVLRRTFQRYWIQIMLGAAVTWARSAGVDRIGILRFPFRSEEDVQGHVVRRVYAELPERISGVDETVRVGDESHLYSVAPIASVESYLGTRFSRP